MNEGGKESAMKAWRFIWENHIKLEVVIENGKGGKVIEIMSLLISELPSLKEGILKEAGTLAS